MEVVASSATIYVIFIVLLYARTGAVITVVFPFWHKTGTLIARITAASTTD